MQNGNVDMNFTTVFKSISEPICTWMILNSTAAFKMLITENAIDTAPVVGNVTVFPVKMSGIVIESTTFQGFGTLPVTINQT